MSVKFWTRYKDSWVRLRLKDNQEVFFTEGGPNEEGYSYSSTVLRREGNVVYREIANISCDCDGRFDCFCKQECSINQLSAFEVDDGIMVPDWREIDYSQRDYTAESMGY